MGDFYCAFLFSKLVIQRCWNVPKICFIISYAPRLIMKTSKDVVSF